jgi:hypothetical protein
MRHWNDMSDEYHRELAEYDPGDDRRVHSATRARVLRIMVVLGLVGLVLPGVLVTIGTQIATADAACGIVVAKLAPDSVGTAARFELAGADGPGWYCYALQYGGSEVLVRFIGLIPGLRSGPIEPGGQQA